MNMTDPSDAGSAKRSDDSKDIGVEADEAVLTHEHGVRRANNINERMPRREYRHDLTLERHRQ